MRLMPGLYLVLAACAASPSAIAAPYKPDPTHTRAQVPDGYKWKPEQLFASTAAWEEALKGVQARLPELQACEGKMGASSTVLLGCLQTRDTVLQGFYKVYGFASYQFDVNMAADDTKARMGQVKALEPAVNSAMSFFTPEIIAIPQATLDGYLKESEKLKVYDYAIQDARRLKDHTLSPAEEKILAITANIVSVPGDAHESLLEVDARYGTLTDENGKQVELTQTGFRTYRASRSLDVRKQATQLFFGTLRSYENTLATLIDGVAKAHIMNKDARRYGSCLEASLTPDNLSPAAYTMLIDTVRANLPRTLHKYIALRRKILGLEGKVTFPNLYNPMIDIQEPTYSYDEGRKLILEGLKPLGKDYAALLTTGMDPAAGWIDVYPNADKRSGAYSSGFIYDSHPYVLHNFDDTMDGVYTTAHEYGHALHSVYTNKNQPFIYSNYTTFLAEIASTTNEELLLSHMLKTTKDPKVRLLLLNQRLENIRLTIFRQTLFAEFEKRFHEQAEQGQAITPAFLNGLYSELITTYYGPDYEMGADDSMEWGFIPHFYYNFYVFAYATGLTSGISLSQQIIKDPKAAERYKTQLLSAGSSAPPMVILRNAGVDLETSKPILDMLDLFEKTLAEFEKTYAQVYGNKK